MHVHGDRLRVGFFREGKDAIADDFSAIVDFELFQEQEDLGIESFASDSLLEVVEGRANQRLVDPKLFFLFNAGVVYPECVFRHIGSHVVRLKVAIQVNDDLALFVAELRSLSHGEIERHRLFSTKKALEVDFKCVRFLVLQFFIELFNDSFDGTIDEIEAIGDSFHNCRLDLVDKVLLPEFLLDGHIDVV